MKLRWTWLVNLPLTLVALPMVWQICLAGKIDIPLAMLFTVYALRAEFASIIIWRSER
jgi:hypothetical protein